MRYHPRDVRRWSTSRGVAAVSCLLGSGIPTDTSTMEPMVPHLLGTILLPMEPMVPDLLGSIRSQVSCGYLYISSLLWWYTHMGFTQYLAASSGLVTTTQGWYPYLAPVLAPPRQVSLYTILVSAATGLQDHSTPLQVHAMGHHIWHILV